MGIQYDSEKAFSIEKDKRNLRTLDYRKYGRGIAMFSPTAAIIAHSMHEASGDVAHMAEFNTVMNVYRHNSDCIVAFARGGRRESPGETPTGMLAHLPLNIIGARALISGEMNTANPPLAYVCRQNERPAAIYFWFVHLPGDTGGGLGLAMERLTSEKYAKRIPLFCKPANEKARAFFETLGFVMGAAFEGYHSKTIMSCDAPDMAAGRRLYDNYVPGAAVGTKRTSVKVVHGADDLLKCIAIRGGAYLEDRHLPMAEDIDGNDFTATHLLGYVGDEPAGCLRLRYWADFVKLERLAVLSRFRGPLALDLVRAGLAFAQEKGYRRFYGQAAEPVTKIWERFGFVKRGGPGIQYLTDEVYYEMDLVVDLKCEPVGANSGAAVLVRREGEWDRPGDFEFAQMMRPEQGFYMPPDPPF